tara:strand:+ start:458 stop:1831 length:1374 start_codon:yes stop_codon:yes gene_type:complete
MIKKKNISNIFFAFLAGHLFIWTLIPTISNQNLPLDTIEALAWGSNLDWGFTKHPPVSALAAEIFFQIFSNSDWAYYLLSQIFVVTSFFVVWKFSQNIFNDKMYSLISVFLLEGIYFYNFTTPEFNVNVCQLPFWALAVYFCWEGIKHNKTKDWLLLGFFAALGFLSKYLFIYLLIGIKIYFFYKVFKEKKFNLNYLIPGVFFLILITPHIIWLVDNNYSSLKYAFNRTGVENENIINHLIFPFIFLFKQIGILVPFLVMFVFLIKKLKVELNFKDKKLIFLLAINLIPIFLIFITSFLFGVKVRTMWMTPFYLFFGVLMVYLFKKSINLSRFRYFISSFIFLFILSPSLYFYVSHTQDNKRTDFPGNEIAYLVQSKWDKNFSNDIGTVIGDEWFAGNLSYHLKSRPKWFKTINKKIDKIDSSRGVVYAGNPKILKKICPGVFGTIKPIGICMIGAK